MAVHSHYIPGLKDALTQAIRIHSLRRKQVTPRGSAKTNSTLLMEEPSGSRTSVPPLLPQIASHPGIMAIDITDKFAAAVKSM